MTDKPIRNNISFGILEDGRHVIIDHKNVPDDVRRSSVRGSVDKGDPTAIERLKVETVEYFKYEGLSKRGRNRGSVYLGDDKVCLVVVSIDELRAARPDFFRDSDYELLETYQKMQRGEGVTYLSRDELERAKRLWSEHVSLGVGLGVAKMKRETEEREENRRKFPIQGNYADDLPNC